MPCAIPQPLREEIVSRHQAGETLAGIALDLKLCYRSVRGIWQRYRQRGAAGLPPDYARCGRPGPRGAPELYAAALAAKRAHPRWGGTLIRLHLGEQFPAQPLPSVRTLQEWFRQAGLQTPRNRRPSAPRTRAREVHAVWQLDGKEGMRLADGTPTVTLTLVDEASGAVLSTAAFPPQQVRAGAGPRRARLAAPGVPAVGDARAPADG
jgi:hypothetical protein